MTNPPFSFDGGDNCIFALTPAVVYAYFIAMQQVLKSSLKILKTVS